MSQSGTIRNSDAPDVREVAHGESMRRARAGDSKGSSEAVELSHVVNDEGGATGRHNRGSSERPRFMARTKSFTRRTRDLPPNLKRTMEKYGSDYVIDVERGEGWTTVAEDYHLKLHEVFGRSAPITVEIGPGVGDQLVAAADRWPERDFLALEVFAPGIAKIVSKAAAAGVSNVRIIEADAAQALPIILGEASVDELWTFFPDPWRKARHRKRRLISDSFAKEVARLLVDGGAWRIATDWDDYAWQARDVIEGCAALVNPYEGERPDPNDPTPERGGFAPRWEGRVLTHFEDRGHDAGRQPHDLLAVRMPRETDK